jgi:hypothetical protein
MAKDADQTQDKENQDTSADEAIEKQDKASTDAAVKTSRDFDKLLDEEGVEETPSDEDDSESKDDKKSETKDDSKADDSDKDTDKDEDKDSDKKSADDKGTDDKGDDKTEVSDDLAKRAADVGITEDEIEQIESAEELEEIVKNIESVVAPEGKKDQSSAHTDTTPDKSKDDTGKKKDDLDSLIKFADENDIDPDIVKNLKALEKKGQGDSKAVKELSEKVDRMIAATQQQQQQQFRTRNDGMIEKLGIEFADVFGIGSINELDESSTAWKNRDAVRAQMYAYANGLHDAKLPIPPEQELFDLAIRSLHGKKLETVTGLRLGKKTKARSKQRSGRAATKRKGAMTGDEKAYATSRAFDDLIDSTEE